MGLFLTSLELHELTGYKLANKQVDWLANRGYYVETNARGIPRITYTQVEDKRRNSLSNNFISSNLFENITYQSEPNFTNFHKKINSKINNNG